MKLLLQSTGRVLMKIKERVRTLQYQKAKQHLLTRAVKEGRPVVHVKDERIRQPLNHFDSQNTKTFLQVSTCPLLTWQV